MIIKEHKQFSVAVISWCHSE